MNNLSEDIRIGGLLFASINEVVFTLDDPNFLTNEEKAEALKTVSRSLGSTTFMKQVLRTTYDKIVAVEQMKRTE